jgi:hypothetical protein
MGFYEYLVGCREDRRPSGMTRPPPQSGKSLYLSSIFSCWWHNPRFPRTGRVHCRIIEPSAGHTLTGHFDSSILAITITPIWLHRLGRSPPQLTLRPSARARSRNIARSADRTAPLRLAGQLQSPPAPGLACRCILDWVPLLHRTSFRLPAQGTASLPQAT